MADSRWAEVVRSYYEAKNQIWYRGESAVRTVRTIIVPRARLGAQEAVLWHRWLAGRRRTAIRVMSRVDTRRVTPWPQPRAVPGDSPGKANDSLQDRLLVDVTEHVRLLYRIREEVCEERRMYPWRVTLVGRDQGWRIAEERLLNDVEQAGWGARPPLSPGDEKEHSPGWWRERWRKLFSFRRFDRLQVFKYAELWWDAYNPRFRAFRVDCTNFVSQCLWHGGMPMEMSESVEQGWWYAWQGDGQDRWSLSWAVSHSLYWYLRALSERGRVRFIDHPQQLHLGDVIFYDWNGDGTWQHTAVVADFDPEGRPLVNAHTTASYHRLWDYRDSPAWSERTRYAFVHIED
ncbi:MAG: amidase domain-containing protein [Alicyclobacillaceae bacterium]|nr:amidase domain-containing protein [Alicyclobacillaceae bacterium]